MKKPLFILIGTLVVGNAFAASQFTCFTRADEGNYVKKMMKLELIGEASAFVQPFDSGIQDWSKGSTGKLVSVDPETGWAKFTGFSSPDMFGDLSEGAANQGIAVYVSPELIAGKSGPASLFAKGAEVGLEKASYFCKAQ